MVLGFFALFEKNQVYKIYLFDKEWSKMTNHTLITYKNTALFSSLVAIISGVLGIVLAFSNVFVRKYQNLTSKIIIYSIIILFALTAFAFSIAAVVLTKDLNDEKWLISNGIPVNVRLEN